jgi:hypothetical protein
MEFDLMDYFGIITIDMTDEQFYEELNQLRSEWDRFNPDDFLGIMSYPIEFLDSEIKKMRGEWDRNI